MYEVRVAGQVRRSMRKIPPKDQARILAAFKGLANNPRPIGYGPVEDALPNTFRIRVGRYRVVYRIYDADQVVVIARVRKRDEKTYQFLR